MARARNRSWVAGRVQEALRRGLTRAYLRVRVDPNEYLLHVRRAHRLPIQSWDDMLIVRQEFVDQAAQEAISAASKVAAIEGTGLGFGGLITVLPDLGVLAAITVRLLQKLSLLHGFTYSTDEEKAQLWLAAATAAGVDLGRELMEKQAIERFVPRAIERIAAKLGAEAAEKWSCRVVPVLSGALGGALNYWFVREWGRRSRQHFREKHLAARSAARFSVLEMPSQVRLLGQPET
jgi:hypothetical protein